MLENSQREAERAHSQGGSKAYNDNSESYWLQKAEEIKAELGRRQSLKNKSERIELTDNGKYGIMGSNYFPYTLDAVNNRIVKEQEEQRDRESLEKYNEERRAMPKPSYRRPKRLNTKGLENSTSYLADTDMDLMDSFAKMNQYNKIAQHSNGEPLMDYFTGQSAYSAPNGESFTNYVEMSPEGDYRQKFRLYGKHGTPIMVETSKSIDADKIKGSGSSLVDFLNAAPRDYVKEAYLTHPDVDWYDNARLSYDDLLRMAEQQKSGYGMHNTEYDVSNLGRTEPLTLQGTAEVPTNNNTYFAERAESIPQKSRNGGNFRKARNRAFGEMPEYRGRSINRVGRGAGMAVLGSLLGSLGAEASNNASNSKIPFNYDKNVVDYINSLVDENTGEFIMTE